MNYYVFLENEKLKNKIDMIKTTDFDRVMSFMKNSRYITYVPETLWEVRK